jgi:phosphopantetheine--protein transferase-like protein
MLPNNSFVVQSNFRAEHQVAVYQDQRSVPIDKDLVCLSKNEIAHADLIRDPNEYRHFVMRRAFQRRYVKMITGFSGPLAELELLHQQDKPPVYSPEPHLCLSFSSSAHLYVGASSRDAKIGIDLEKRRSIANPLEIATRFFHASEVEYLGLLNFEDQQSEFLKFWTIKEACLKAIGRGIVYGLDRFLIRIFENHYNVEPPSEFGTSKNWQINIESIDENHWLTVAEFIQIEGENPN